MNRAIKTTAVTTRRIQLVVLEPVLSSGREKTAHRTDPATSPPAI